MTRVVLASASPRRKELLALLIDDFEVVPSGIEEPWETDPVSNALNLARAKALDVLSRRADAVVIGADTIVFDEARSYGKPEDEGDAFAMWVALRGRVHQVVTGVVVAREGWSQEEGVVAEVQLADLSDERIRRYVASGRPMDKAGAYAIQDEDVPTVARLDGCYCAVMGLPLWTLKALLEPAGVPCRAPSEGLDRCNSGCPLRPVNS